MWRDFFSKLEEIKMTEGVEDECVSILAWVSANYGDAKRSLELLDRVRDGYTYVSALLDIVAELWWKGLVDEATLMFGECEARLGMLKPSEARSLVPKRAYVKTLVEGLEGGVRVAMSEDCVWRCRALLASATAMVEIGEEYGGALKELESCLRGVFDEEKVEVLAEAGRLLLSLGRIDEAKVWFKEAANVARNLYDYLSRRMSLARLLPLLIEAGMLEDATVFSGELGLVGLQYLEKIGRMAGVDVLNMPLEALDAYGRVILFLSGAEASLSHEVATKAAEFVERFSGGLLYPELLARLAALQAKIGKIEEGEANAAKAVSLAGGRQLLNVARHMIGFYDEYAERAVEKACREAEKLRVEERSLVLMEAAAAWSKLHKEREALECFEAAAKLVSELREREVLVEFSRHLASSRNLQMIDRVLRWFPDVESRAFILSQIASFLVDEGGEEWLKAVDMALSSVEHGGVAPQPMIRLAEYLFEKGEVREAQRAMLNAINGVLRGFEEGRSNEALRLLRSVLRLIPVIRFIVRRREERREILIINKGGSCRKVEAELEGIKFSIGELKSGDEACLDISSHSGEEVKLTFEDVFGVEELTLRTLKAQ